MFSTAGYFRGLNCPFFINGLCERPYCHFKHSKPEEGKPQIQRSTSSSNYVESLTDKPWLTKSTEGEITEANTQDATNGENQDSTNGPTKKVIGYNKYTGDPIYEEFKRETYEVTLPTTSDQIKGDRSLISVNKYTGEPIYQNAIKNLVSASSVPEYKPTPIEELKKRNSSNETGNSNEYDPEQNFSTKPIIASHSLPLAPKRVISYEPTSIRPAKIPRKTSYEFDISKFSDSEESEKEKDDPKEEYSPVSTSEERKKSLENDSEQKITPSIDNSLTDKKPTDAPPKIVKDVLDVKYFETLLLSDPKSSSLEDIKKKRQAENEENSLDGIDEKDEKGKLKKDNHVKSDKLNDKVKKHLEDKKVKSSSSFSKTEKEKDESHHKRSSSQSSSKSSSHRNSSDKSHSKNSHRDKKSSESSHREKSSESSHGDKKSSEISHRDKKSSESSHGDKKSSRSSHGDRKSSDSHKSSSSSKHSDSHQSKSHSSSHKSSSSKSKTEMPDEKKSKSQSNEKKSDSSKVDNKHLNGISHTSKSSHDRNHSSKSSHSSKNSHDKKHSSKHSHDKTHSIKNSHERKSSQDKSSSSSKSSDKTKEQNSRSSSSSSKHSDKNTEISSKIKSEKRLSTDSDSKKHIVGINVDLFGEDSDVEMLDDSDIESHPLIQPEDMSDGDAYDECLRIFNESLPTKSGSVKKLSPEKKKHEEPVLVGKKRVAHKADTKEVKRKIPEKPYSKLSPAQVMHNRFLEMRKKALEEAAKLHSASTSSSSSSNTPSTSSSHSKSSRVAHTPKSTTPSKPEKTTITTASKTQKRQARIPNVSNLARPQIPAEFGSKVPTNIRQRYLNTIIDECLKLCDTEEEAFKRGQEEEMVVYNRSNTKTIYLNVAVNAIKKLRNEIAECSPSTSKQHKSMNAMKLSHEAVLGGKNALKTSYTVKRSGQTTKVIEDFKGAELYNRLSRYILTEEQLKDNGYPLADPDNPGTAIIQTDNTYTNTYKKNDRLHEKICVRCGKKFIVYPTGKYAKQEECIYHWAKAWKRKVNGLFDSRYNCCQGDSSSEGCQVAKYHVHETNKWENLSGFMKSLPCSPPVDGDYGVFAMDCEMVYTTAGVELARVTVCDQDNTAVYETFVKPDSDVVDFNTRFSGITDEDLEDVTTTLRDVQAVLLSLITDKTILLGHSLESDLQAVKIIHRTVVDTSIVFPHRLGAPYKRALRTLTAEYLQKIIQDDVGGHDSMEDAVSCMELMHYKLREDARKER